MIHRKRSQAWILLAPVALLVAGLPLVTQAEPNLSVAFSQPAYTAATRCDLTQALAFVNLTVANQGNSPTSALQTTAADASGVLAGDRTVVPAIAPGSRMNLRIPLHHIPASAGAVGGTHLVIVTVGAQRLGPLAVTLPLTLCPSTPSTAGRLGGITPGTTSERVRGVEPVALLPPDASDLARARAQAPKVYVSPHTPAVPVNLRVARDAPDCATHVGLLGAFACPDMVRSKNVLLVWDWRAGGGPSEIDGFRLYNITASGKWLAYTRTNKQDVTLIDLPVPGGGYPGKCYGLTAFAGPYESALSSPLCLTRENTIVLASPTVAVTPTPRAPRHVTIHVTSDEYPSDTVVAAGGDVTWINDDTDDHTVYDGTYSNVIVGLGGHYTMTFRDLGYGGYTVKYNCQYHQDMVGTIHVVVNP